MKDTAKFSKASCDVFLDPPTRLLYATDASIYQVQPLGVAFPRNASQASSIIKVAANERVPIIPRGAGTGLVGGAIGEGLIVEFSRYNRLISGLDLEKRTVRVGSGVVLDELNAHLKPHSFCFGPDVATSSRATLGGMIANNSSGSHVPVYGTTADHVRSLEVVLADGRIEEIGCDCSGLASERKALTTLIESYRADISRELPPGLLKRYPGFGIDRFLREPRRLQHLLAGSEGTLAAITAAELDIVPLPKQRGVGLLFFASVSEAMQATVELLDLKPAAIEHIDRVLFDQTRGQLPFTAVRSLLELDTKPCEAILIVEFFDDVAERLALLSQKKLGLRRTILRSTQEMNLVWAMRKAGLSLLTGCPGRAKPVTGIEDTAVRPEHLPAYVAGLESILQPLGLRACYYGHAATGLLHVRPVLDLHAREDLGKFRQVSDQVSALVRQFKGSLAAEHGVGIARTEYMQQQLGKELMSLHARIKSIFDPSAAFNPGKILDNGRYRFDADLRFQENLSAALPFVPTLVFAAKDHSFIGNLEQCNGCGGCRKQTATMCPTFIATGDEMMSTRGRANMIRAALEQRLGPDPLRSAALEVALSNCISCKACTTECPSNVNLALLKAEMLHARFQRDGLPLRERILSSIDLLGRLGTIVPDLANASLGWPWLRTILENTIGLAKGRPLPRFAEQRFDYWFERRRSPHRATRGPVILWDDTFVRYYDPHIGIAAVTVLEAAGFEVRLLRGRRCCGRPAFSQGNLDAAAAQGLHNVELLNQESYRDLPIIFLEPSCYSMFAEDYRELNLRGVDKLRCYLFEEFVEAVLADNPGALVFTPKGKEIVIHAHCHAKSLLNTGFMERLARRLPGVEARLLQTGCCGMAGAFGMLEAKLPLSIQMAQPLVEQVEAQSSTTTVVASGTSCRHQIEYLTSRHPYHMAEVLAGGIVSREP